MSQLEDLLKDAVARCGHLASLADTLSRHVERIAVHARAIADRAERSVPTLTEALTSSSKELKIVEEAVERSTKPWENICDYVRDTADTGHERAKTLYEDLRRDEGPLGTLAGRLTGRIVQVLSESRDEVDALVRRIDALLADYRTMRTGALTLLVSLQGDADEAERQMDARRGHLLEEVRRLEAQARTATTACGQGVDVALEAVASSLKGFGDRLAMRHGQAIEDLRRHLVDEARTWIDGSFDPLRQALSELHPPGGPRQQAHDDRSGAVVEAQQRAEESGGRTAAALAAMAPS